MSERASSAPGDNGPEGPAGGVHVDDVFDVHGASTPEKHRVVQRYLTQSTRYHVVQTVLAHPSHLPSLTELDYYIEKNASTVREHCENLAEHEILARYHHEPNVDSRGLPSEFWGLTPFGIDLISEYNFLRSLPVLRATHDHTEKSATIQRHEDAPRPDLPDAVAEALAYDEPDATADLPTEDGAVESTDSLDDEAVGDRSLDELL